LLRWSALVQGIAIVLGLLTAGAGYFPARRRLSWPSRLGGSEPTT
jgi:hypothetical protein